VSLAREVAEAEGAPERSELAIVLCSDEEILRLNRKFRGRNSATNVLAFSARDPRDPQIEGEPVQIGDVVVSLDTATREALAAGIEPAERVKRLVVHGILHLFGHNHESQGGQAEMEALEEHYLMPASKGIDKR
jgi:rRNA maturation RNase YbeY